jgi:hypothetical protein
MGVGHRSTIAIAAAAAVALLCGACSSTTPSGTPAHKATPRTTAPPPSSRTTTPGKTSTRTTAPAHTTATAVTWLCRPGMADDPCLSSLDATVVQPGGHTHSQPESPAAAPKIDCFYVYPTVSTQPTANADLTVDPQETAVAVAQASRFSSVCNVYAPMYRQLTVAAILGQAHATAADRDLAYADVAAAWEYYLDHYNHGRGVAFIGHSQGAAMLIDLLKQKVDADPAVRARLVSAILLGGNVTVPVGQTVGGTFAHIPACTNVTRPGCIIAYSSFDQVPPSNSIFGRVSSPVNALSGQTPVGQLQVLCVNPVAGTGPGPGASTASTMPVGSGPPGNLSPYFPTSTFPGGSVPSARKGGSSTVSTPWVTFPHLYQAQCMSQGGATWLQVDDIAAPGDTRPVVKPVLGPTWGLHLEDVNIALGNLVSDLQRQAARYPG